MARNPLVEEVKKVAAKALVHPKYPVEPQSWPQLVLQKNDMFRQIRLLQVPNVAGIELRENLDALKEEGSISPELFKATLEERHGPAYHYELSTVFTLPKEDYDELTKKPEAEAIAVLLGSIYPAESDARGDYTLVKYSANSFADRIRGPNYTGWHRTGSWDPGPMPKPERPGQGRLFPRPVAV